MRDSGLYKLRMEENLPYGWEHTRPQMATMRYGRSVNIDFLCHYLGRYRKGSQAWEQCCALGIDYEAGLGDGIVRQNVVSPNDGQRLFPDWVVEVGFPAPPLPSPLPAYQAPPPPLAPRVTQYADQIPFAPSNWASFPPPPAPVAPAPHEWEFAADSFPASFEASSFPPAPAAPQQWEFTADPFPASFEASSFPPAPAPAPQEWEFTADPGNDCAMTFSHAPAVNPWAAAANPPPSPAPASIEATVMPPALPGHNWHPENPFPVEHGVPFFSPSPAPAPADVPMTDEQWRARFRPVVVSDPVLDAFKRPGLTEAEASDFASKFAGF